MRQTPLGFWNPNGSSNLGQTTRPSNSQQKKEKKKEKRTCQIVDFAVPADHIVELKETKKKDKYLDLAREFKKKTVECESDGDTNHNWCSWYSNQKIDSGTGGLGNKRTSGDHPKLQHYYWEESWRLEETQSQTPVRNHWLVWKTRKRVMMMLYYIVLLDI